MNFIINNKSNYKKVLDEVKKEKRLAVHSFHRYYGKLIPAIPRAFIREFTDKGDLVFDPFTGSGTTSVEAIFSDRNFLGVELNPLSKLIAEVKSCKYNIDKLWNYFDEIKKLYMKVEYDSNSELPFVVNRDHWFKSHVQEDLSRLTHSIKLVFKSSKNKKYENFFIICVSAIIKNVSNADERHVFPGVSKRMRALEAEKPIMKDVFEVFERAVKKRITSVSIYDLQVSESRIHNGDSSKIDLSKYYEKVDLIVTNPPYISSVRYVETLKLELYWMEFIKDQTDYKNLLKKSIGNDKYNKGEYENQKHTGYPEIDKKIDELYTVDLKSSKIVYDYFENMEKVVSKCYQLLKPNSRLVMKISDSKIKKNKIETGKLLSIIAASIGFEVEDIFTDEIQKNSRSLTTSRNTYSDIILRDFIIIWRKP